MGDCSENYELNCLYGNLQSLNSKKKEIELRTKNCAYDLLLFTEIWINDKNQACEYTIPGFQDPVIDPNIRGGAGIYVREGMEFFVVQPPNKVNESVWIVLKTRDNVNRLYACIYRSPNSVDANNEKLINNIIWARDNFSECVFIGDFNLPQIRWEVEQASTDFCRKFLECLQDKGLEQIISEPTRFRGDQTPSILDLIIVSDPDLIPDKKIEVPFGNSDHCSIEFTVKNCKNMKKITKNQYDFEKINDEIFCEAINVNDWDNICIESTDLDTAYDKFIQILNQAIVTCTPNRKSRAKNKALWTTKLVSKLARKKRHLWDKYKRSRLREDYDLYKQGLNEFEQKKDIAILNYENKIIAGKDAHPKQFYSYVSLKNKYGNSKIVLKNDDDIETNEYKCANLMNNFFSSVFTTGVSELPEFETGRTFNLMPEIILTEPIIRRKLEQLDIHKASGPDHVPCVILRKFADALAPILLKLYSRSYNEGHVPRTMKQAHVVPIHKAGARTSTNNYRPVSLTPILAKVFESLFYDVMLAHIESNDILKDVQHGFRKARSTNSNLLLF